jgi:hypothetical protein
LDAEDSGLKVELMPTDNDLVLTIREILRQIPPGGTADTLDIAKTIVAEFEARGDRRSVEDVRSLIRLDAAAIGVGVKDR